MGDLINNTVEDTTTDAAPDWAKLGFLDYCDKCGSQAYVRAHKGNADLLWCAHHYAEYEVLLMAEAWNVSDEREPCNCCNCNVAAHRPPGPSSVGATAQPGPGTAGV